LFVREDRQELLPGTERGSVHVRAGARTADPEAKVEQAIRLLVADDESDYREALVLALGPGYEVIGAVDGEEALALARSGHPDVILLDLNMPKLDGFQVLERLQLDPGTADIPVLVLSARKDDAGKVSGLALGAVDYLEKPCSVPELRARLERTVRLMRSQRALRALAQTDPLTGLANRRALLTRLGAESRRARRYRTSLTCVMVDLDGLKKINDDLGHAAGDAVILAVATLLREELRETDLGARVGGDEFVLLLPHTDAEAGRTYAERICARLHQAQLELDGVRVPLSGSFGVACQAPGDVRGSDELLRAADGALYRAKATGRGRVVVAAAPAGPV
jgi:diguanylate cyclase (GGDEF)-like protein